MTCSTYNCGRRGPFKHMNRRQLFRKSLEHSPTVFILSHAIPLPLFATPLAPPCYPALLLGFSTVVYLFPSLRMLHRAPDSGESSSVLLACSNRSEGRERVRRAPVISNSLSVSSKLFHEHFFLIEWPSQITLSDFFIKYYTEEQGVFTFFTRLHLIHTHLTNNNEL